MKKAIFIFLSMLLLPMTVRADYDQQKTVDYLKQLTQNHATTSALIAAGEQKEGLDTAYLQDLSNINQDTAATLAGYILAVIALGEDPRMYGTENMVTKLKGYFENGQLGTTNCPWIGGACTNDDIWGILALSAAGEDAESDLMVSLKNFLVNSQNDNRGWGSSDSANSDTDSTASAVMALLEFSDFNQDSPIIQNALTYIKTQQTNSGGFSCGEFVWCQDDIGMPIANPDTTAWVLSMIYKLNQNPEASEWRQNDSETIPSPISYLRLQQQETGQIGFGTAYALIALMGKFYPLFYFTPPVPEPAPTGGGVPLPLMPAIPPKPNLTSETYIPAGAPAKINIKDEHQRIVGEIIIQKNFFIQPITLFTKAIKKEELSETQQSINLISPYIYDLQILDGNQKEITEFDNMVEIKLFYQNSDLLNLIKPEELQIVYWDKTAYAWIALEKNQIDLSQKSARAFTKHFTLFAVSYGLEIEKPANKAGEQKNIETEEHRNIETEEQGVTGKLSYPDGALIKAIDNPAVYLIEQGRKRWIPNEKILRFRFLGQEIEFVDQEIINSLPEGLEVLYPNGSYLRSLEDSRIFRIKNNKKYQIRSLETWLYICGDESPILVDVEIKELNKYELGGLVV